MKKTTNTSTYKGIDDLPLTLSIDDLMSVLKIGRSTAYDLVRTGKIRGVKVGHQIRITREALLGFLNGESD